MELKKRVLFDDIGVKTILLYKFPFKICLAVCDLDLFDTAERLLHTLQDIGVVFSSVITETR